MSNIKKIFTDSAKLKNKIVEFGSYKVLEEIGTQIGNLIQNGNKIMLCGNGGSATNAQHLAAESKSHTLQQDIH